MSPGCMFHKALEEEHVPEIDSLLNFALVSRRDGCTEALSKVCENTTKGRTHLCKFTWKLQFHHGINHSHNRCLEQSQQEKKADGEARNSHQASKAQPKAPSRKTQEHWTCWECVSGCLSRILILVKGRKGKSYRFRILIAELNLVGAGTDAASAAALMRSVHPKTDRFLRARK